MREVPRDQAPLRVVEIFLLHLLDEEEGERLGDPSADGMCGHPPSGAAGGRVHALLALQIQQGLALALVLPEGRPCRSLAGCRCFELPPTSKFLVLRVWLGWCA